MGAHLGLGLAAGGFVLLGFAPLGGSVMLAACGVCWAIAVERGLNDFELGTEPVLAVVPVEPDRR